MKIVATIEARMNSTRLPGKVLIDIGGIRSLECQIQRLKQSKLIDEIVLATTLNSNDDVLEKFADEIGVRSYRGSEEDVLGRILRAVKSVQGEVQVQTTGDCPLIDPVVVDQVIQYYLDFKCDFDFVSNEIERTFPIGLDCRVFPVNVLEKVDKLCDDPLHRVHGSTYIYLGLGKERFRSKNISAPPGVYSSKWRWTLDTKEDLAFIRNVMKHFRDSYSEFSSLRLAEWLKLNPAVAKINSDVVQKFIEEG
jgi:spore coat polysaccharide biosynthesis protein SpsF